MTVSYGIITGVDNTVTAVVAWRHAGSRPVRRRRVGIDLKAAIIVEVDGRSPFATLQRSSLKRAHLESSGSKVMPSRKPGA
jgi:hypothetical protein